VAVDGLDETLQVTRQDPESGVIFSRGDSLPVGWNADDALAYPR